MIDQEVNKRRWIKFLTHLALLVILFLLPDLLFRYGSRWRPTGIHLLGAYLKTAVFIGVFYVEYFLILNHTLFRQRKNKVLAYFLWNVGLLLAATVVLLTIQYFCFCNGHGHRHLTHEQEMLRNASFVLRDLGMLALVIGLSTAMRFGENWAEMETRHEQMLASQQADELQNLKSQLNPHFLFNTLNTIYALIGISPSQAQDAIHQLSALLRYALYENPASVHISQEVNFLRNYISLMGMRLGDDAIKSEFKIDKDVEVAPLLFITLLENAFKHGNTGVKDQPIEFTLTADADGTVVCNTRNHFINNPDKKEKGGIGLSNLRRRLHLIYGSDASLTTHVEGDVFTATLTIKTNTATL